MNVNTVSFFAAFAAGLLSFLSPCVLPLIPSYVTFLTGLSLEDAQNARRTAMVHAVLFVLGFSLIFLALGAGATALGSLLFEYRQIMSRVLGVLVLVMGLYLMGIFNIGFLARERRVHLSDKPVGYLGSVLVGIAFGLGWSPCIGPLLGTILGATMTYTPDMQRGMLLLGAYSFGLAVPFLLAALLLRRFLEFFAKARKMMVWIQRVSGALLVIVGLLMITNYFSVLGSYLMSLTPNFLLKYLIDHPSPVTRLTRYTAGHARRVHRFEWASR